MHDPLMDVVYYLSKVHVTDRILMRRLLIEVSDHIMSRGMDALRVIEVSDHIMSRGMDALRAHDSEGLEASLRRAFPQMV
ncbi:hypothetical protein HYT54_03510 [Candidatus Woesearchaeota archaeon]|nr:hypothetical protein [Candidatus Woesearchaeota archaeon]